MSITPIVCFPIVPLTVTDSPFLSDSNDCLSFTLQLICVRENCFDPTLVKDKPLSVIFDTTAVN